MKTLTIVFISARPDPKFEWFLHSLLAQLFDDDIAPRIIVVKPGQEDDLGESGHFSTVSPKPTIWQGKHRLTDHDWWAISNARNTGICLAQTEWIAFVDDRCVLGPQWLEAIKDAMVGNYMVCGSYEKRWNMRVENGVITDPGKVNSIDNRIEYCEKNNISNPSPCAGNWTYGCGIAMPLEWALSVGGFEEAMDGIGFEDVIFGLMCQNNSLPIKYDRRMHLIEDRTPGDIGTAMRREDRGASPLDKSHRSLELFGTARNTSNRHRLLQSRQAVQAGKPWPMLMGEKEDWWNADPINADYMKR